MVRRYTSAAAGAYQFLPTTWKGVARLRLLASSPTTRTRQPFTWSNAVVLKEGDRKGLTKAAMAKLAPEWASFPNISGRSAYGQPVKTHQGWPGFCNSNLRSLRRQARA